MLFLASFGPSKSTVWLKFGPESDSNIILILNTPESAIEGLNTHVEDILLLAALAITEFSKCTGSFAKNSFQIELIIRNFCNFDKYWIHIKLKSPKLKSDFFLDIVEKVIK